MSKPSSYQQIVLASTPAGMPSEDNFLLESQPMPNPGMGEVLCASRYLSLDPYMRSQIAGRHISGSIQPGDPLRGETVSEVVESRHPDFAPGDLVRCFGGWRSHSLHTGAELTRLAPDIPHPSLALSTLGMPGLTAWAGLYQIANLKAGETVVIPAATGGVGAVAGQLARARGCRVIGIAGGPEKCRVATERLGYHACIDRHQSGLAAALSSHCPDGIDVYFDLVGGDTLQTVSEQLALNSRVILAGSMADYNRSERPGGPPPGLWIKARATVFGLVVYDFENQREQFLQQALTLYHGGELVGHEDMSQGLASAPAAFCRLMRGENQGKAVVALGDST